MCVLDEIDHHERRSLLSLSLVEDGQILLRTYSTMMASETPNNAQENNYDSLLENAQRTVFLKELFAQVTRLKAFRMFTRMSCLALPRSIGHNQYYSTNSDEKFHSMLGSSCSLSG